MSRRGLLLALAAAVLFGASAPAASRLVGEVGAFSLAGLLYLGAALAVAPAVVASARRTETASFGESWRHEGRALVGAVVVGGGVGPALLMAGLARTSAASASLLLNLELAATVALAATVFREHLGVRVIAGAALVTAAGAVLVAEPGASLDTGALLVVAACVAWGVDNGLTAGIERFRPESVVLAKGVVAGSANLAIGLLVGEPLLDGVAPATLLGALVVGALGYGVSIVAWVHGARDLGAARAQIVFATAPFLGAAVAWVVLGEGVEGRQLVALGLAAVGVGVSLDSAHGHRHHHTAVAHDHLHDHDDHHSHAHASAPVGAHGHPHRHDPIDHSHPHVPDLHHRHDHRDGDEVDR